MIISLWWQYCFRVDNSIQFAKIQLWQTT